MSTETDLIIQRQKDKINQLFAIIQANVILGNISHDFALTMAKEITNLMTLDADLWEAVSHA